MTNRPPPLNCSGRPTQLERSIEAGERHFLVSRIKKAPDIAVLGQAACSYWPALPAIDNCTKHSSINNPFISNGSTYLWICTSRSRVPERTAANLAAFSSASGARVAVGFAAFAISTNQSRHALRWSGSNFLWLQNEGTRCVIFSWHLSCCRYRFPPVPSPNRRAAARPRSRRLATAMSKSSAAPSSIRAISPSWLAFRKIVLSWVRPAPRCWKTTSNKAALASDSCRCRPIIGLIRTGGVCEKSQIALVLASYSSIWGSRSPSACADYRGMQVSMPGPM